MSQNENDRSSVKSAEAAELLKRGYEEMAQLNLALANMCFEADEEALVCYEEKLTECE